MKMLKNAKMRNALILFPLIPVFILMFAIWIFVSNNIVKSSKEEVKTRFLSATSEISHSLDQAIEFSTNFISNPYLLDLFETTYDNMESNLMSYTLLNALLTNYNTNGETPKMTVYHNNDTMYKNAFSRSVSDIDEKLFKKITALQPGDFLWYETNKCYKLYKYSPGRPFFIITEYNYEKKEMDSSFEKFGIDKSAFDNISVTDDAPTDSSVLSNKLPNGKYVSLKFDKKISVNIYLISFFIFITSFILFTYIISALSKIFIKRYNSDISRFIDTISIETNFSEIHFPNYANDIMLPAFNKIVELTLRIKDFITENNRISKEKNDILLKYTQSQFNPHLFYNILSVIKWKCLKYDEQLAVNIDNAVDYYRACINGNAECSVELQDEIDMADKYIKLLNTINQHNYSFKFEIEDSIMHFKTIKHLIQPFIENAILHGISQIPDGYIHVKGYRDGNNVIINISDNGIGISEETLKKIRENSYESKYKNYGIKNTYERIKLFHGEDSELTVNSKENAGTTIKIIIKQDFNS